MNGTLTKEIIGELKWDFLDNREACLRLADDFNQLIRTPEEDFMSIKDQPWYKRIWHTFGGQNLQKVGAGLHSLAQAQSVVTELIRITSSNHLKGMEFVDLVSKDMEYLQARQGQLIGHLAKICDEISIIKKQLQYQRTQVIDENELPEEVRVLILRAMIRMAHIDGQVCPSETELITRKVDSMALSEKARRIVLNELETPTPLKVDIRTLDSHKVRSLLYRNLAAVAAADGQIHTKEKLFLGMVVKKLGIDVKEAGEILRDLLHLQTVKGLDHLISSVVDSLGKKAAEEIARAKAEEDAANAERFRQVVQELAESWMNLVGKVADMAPSLIQAPLLKRLDAYAEADTIMKGLDAIDESALRAELNDAAESYCCFSSEGLDKAVTQVFPFLATEYRALWSQTTGKKVHAKVTDELRTSFLHLPQLKALADRLRKCDDAFLSRFIEGGALGLGLGVLTGGLGVLAAVGYGWWKDKQHSEENAKCLEEYQNCLKTFAESNDEVMERIRQHLWDAGAEYFDDVLVPALDKADVEYEPLKQLSSVLLSACDEIDKE